MKRTIIALFAFVGLVATQASARDVVIHGTYSAGKLGAICANNGGHFFNTAGGGYGCTAGNGNGGTVTCTGKGKCKGWAPLLSSHGGKTKTGPTTVKGGSDGNTNGGHRVTTVNTVNGGNSDSLPQGKAGGMQHGGGYRR